MAGLTDRILITGASGLLGLRLVELYGSECPVLAVRFTNQIVRPGFPNVDWERADLTEGDNAARLISEFNPTMIVSCAAMTDVDMCESATEIARAINCGIVENLTQAIDDLEVRLVHISTDYVFDGSEAQPSEKAATNPLNIYGETKLCAEKAISECGCNSLIIRTSALYDCRRLSKANLFTSTHDRLKAGETVSTASDVYCNPMWALNLAECIREISAIDINGILNIAGPVYQTRYEFSLAVARHFGYPEESVLPVKLDQLNRPANRPRLAGLNTAKARSLLATELLTPEQAFSHAQFAVE
jgi:dTDP-4-dehydrorhamnose reductase